MAAYVFIQAQPRAAEAVRDALAGLHGVTVETVTGPYDLAVVIDDESCTRVLQLCRELPGVLRFIPCRRHAPVRLEPSQLASV